MTYSAPRAYPSLADVSSALPTFALAELVFLAVAALALAHAWTRPGAHPNGRQRHVLLFVFAIIGGSLSDLFFVSIYRLENQEEATPFVLVFLSPAVRNFFFFFFCFCVCFCFCSCFFRVCSSFLLLCPPPPQPRTKARRKWKKKQRGNAERRRR
jgi:hypothetical protein